MKIYNVTSYITQDNTGKPEEETHMIAHISEDGLNRKESVAEHTKKTVFLCGEKGRRCGLARVMSLCAIYHDMGKEKDSFSTYILADEKVRRKLKGTISHASTGAKYIYERYHDSRGDVKGSAKIMVEMISYAIAAHHGMFDCVDADHNDIFFAKLNKVDDYDEAYRNAKQDYLSEYDEERIFREAAEEFDLCWNRINELFGRLKPLLLSGHNINAKEAMENCRLYLLACLQRLILSILIDSDWEATSYFMNNVDVLSKPAAYNTKDIFQQAGRNFEAYMQEKHERIELSRLSDQERVIYEARNSLQEECRRFGQYPAGIYCLPIPTGGGKTLGSLAYALEYCRLYPETERVIYVSPFISITEQNAQVFREAIGEDDWILEHHSSVIRKEEGTGEDYRSNITSRFDINWEEPFICTTFVQFMNTLFSDKGESIRRMHRLVNAVVIIDEVQSMPVKCIHTFNYMCNFLNAVCNTNIILCTATQPTLAEAKCPICYSKPKYMIENAADWFYKFERVKITTPEADSRYSIESLAEEIAGRTVNCRSILVVLNTKSAVRSLYDRLKVRGIPAEYLTTNLCAEHRSDKIKKIKEILEKKRETIVVVSTNLIEAGVDISFEYVYRSMAGLDSVAQAAGRCNRNGELESGMIQLIDLEGENAGNMTELQQNIRATESVIWQYKDSAAQDSLLMPKWMDVFYKNVYFNASDKMNFPLKGLDTSILQLLSRGFRPKEKKNLMNQAYKTAGQQYRVIDDDSFGVIVPYKKGAKIIEAIQDAVDPAGLKAYIRQAQRYTVNVRGNRLKQFEGLIQPVSDRTPDLYMVASPGAYQMEYGITPEWETLIF